MILPPYPFSLEDPSDMSLEDVLHCSCSANAFCALAKKDPQKWQLDLLQ